MTTTTNEPQTNKPRRKWQRENWQTTAVTQAHGSCLTTYMQLANAQRSAHLESGPRPRPR